MIIKKKKVYMYLYFYMPEICAVSLTPWSWVIFEKQVLSYLC